MASLHISRSEKHFKAKHGMGLTTMAVRNLVHRKTQQRSERILIRWWRWSILDQTHFVSTIKAVDFHTSLITMLLIQLKLGKVISQVSDATDIQYDVNKKAFNVVNDVG